MQYKYKKRDILLADDDASIRFVLSKFFTKSGYNVRATDNAATLSKWVKSGEGDVVLTDVHMGSDDIFKFIPELKSLRPDLPIIVMSANTSVVTALKSGSSDVFDYIPKPFDLDELENAIKRALDTAAPHIDVQKQNLNLANSEPIIGKSAIMQPVFRAISDFMSADIPVYIYGDVGTGKTHVSKLLHEMGVRSERPFVLFSECENARSLEAKVLNGDLCVDRIHELMPDRQAMLLQALENNERKSNRDAFRIISMSNSPLPALLKTGCIREDLYYRLAGGEINLPSLSQRLEDIPALTGHFLGLKKHGNSKKLNQKTVDMLKAYDWPGNILELKSLMEIITLKFSDMNITPEILKTVLNHSNDVHGEIDGGDEVSATLKLACKALLRNSKQNDRTPYVQALAWVEKPLIEEALRQVGGNKVQAAELLGIHRNTLRTKIKSLGIDV
ncbi:MAG: sigma-54-dependent Fis family transcriptional regulator [Robiginitomaculum sp.]|nr:sigma-54-dependent Fis family transcriptional regulator [Robiginitomaculum sp.]